MNKKTVLIIFGGVSNEYEISLRSACSIRDNLDTTLFNPLLLGITRKGRWLLCHCTTAEIAADTWEVGAIPAMLSPDRLVRGVQAFYPEGARMLPVDVIFPAVHGQNCEDGVLQGAMTLSSIPFVGSGVSASAVCFDKEHTHTVAQRHSIPMASWVCVRRGEDFDHALKRIEKNLGFPVFVKPANSGSSVGTSPAADADSLKKALVNAFIHDNKAIVEELIIAHEVECAVIGNSMPIAPTTGEVVTDNGFYDYNSKYNSNSTANLLIPAGIPPSVQQRVRELAVLIYQIFDCRGLARIDFFVREDESVILNEINTMPGFTSISMYPKMMCSGGMSYKNLITKLLELAAEEN